MRISKTIICYLLLLALSRSCQAQVKGDHDVSKSLRNFAQNFYDSYTPLVLKSHGKPPWEGVLKSKRSEFSTELVRALREDFAAQAKDPGEIVGLDFDPFLNSQDPGEHYEVGKIMQKGDSYFVEVSGVWSGKKSEKPDVVVQLVNQDGHWLFVNFYDGGKYPNGGDLLTILKALRDERQKK
jgi:hypothetical protein